MPRIVFPLLLVTSVLLAGCGSKPAPPPTGAAAEAAIAEQDALVDQLEASQSSE